MKTFLEIGSCDFDNLNYLSDHGWGGVIVEPIKKYLDKIPQKPNVHYLNYAVDWECGVRTMYMAPEELIEQDHDYAGMSSFYNTNATLTRETIVNTITLDKVFEMCNITKLDILKIDAEGHDLEILKMFPFHVCKPKYIRVESLHSDVTAMIGLLSSMGYHCDCDSANISAILIEEPIDSNNFWSVKRKLISNDVYGPESFRCNSEVRGIPLYEVHHYDGYIDFAKEVYNIQDRNSSYFFNWKLAMSSDKTGYQDCPKCFSDETIRIFDIESSTSNVKCNHHYFTYNIKTKKDILDFDRIVELGGGVGDMAKFIRNMGFRGEYIIIDLPEVLEFQKKNLKEHNIQFTSEPVDYMKNTLFISTWALSECPLGWRDTIIGRLKPENYLITYQENFENVSNKDYFSSWDGMEIDIPWIHWDGGSKYLLK